MKKYKIGLAAKHSGVTPQTVRFYEKENLISSFKDEFGTTRYYNARHFKQLANIRRYYKLGFSEEEVRGLMECDSLEAMAEQFASKYGETARQMQNLQLRMANLEYQVKDLARVRSLMGRVQEEENPKMYFLITRRENEMDQSPEVEEALRRWMDAIHLTRLASIIPRDAFVFRPNRAERHSGHCTLEAFYPFIESGEDSGCIRVMHPRPCLRTACVLRGEDISPARLMPHVYEYLQAHGLSVAGDVFGECVAVLDEAKNKTQYFPKETYYEYWIPVEKQSP